MVDIPLDPLGLPARWRAVNARPVQLAITVAILLAILVVLAWSWSAVATDIAQRRCDSPLGKLAIKLKLDSYYSNCRCMTPSLDFSDPCNSMYLGVL
jgi:hypothetical protein